MFTLTSTEAAQQCLQFTPPECKSQSPAPLDLDWEVLDFGLGRRSFLDLQQGASLPAEQPALGGGMEQRAL